MPHVSDHASRLNTKFDCGDLSHLKPLVFATLASRSLNILAAVYRHHRRIDALQFDTATIKATALPTTTTIRHSHKIFARYRLKATGQQHKRHYLFLILAFSL